MDKVALFCVGNYQLFKDYIEEFCEHYYKLGFDCVYITDDAKGQEKLLTSIPYVETKIKEGKIVHLPRYDHPNQYILYESFYNEHKNEFAWCAFFDDDEFLILPKHDTIQEFLSDKTLNFEEKCDSIHICWKNYNDNGYVYKQKGKIVERFKTLALNNEKDSIETKVIVRGGLDKVKMFIGHYALPNNNPNRMAFCDGTLYTSATPFHKKNYEYAILNHYITKSTEEYLRRKSLGRIDVEKDLVQNLKEYKPRYFTHCEKTLEKEKMFDDAISYMEKNHKIDDNFFKNYYFDRSSQINLYCTYYKESQLSSIHNIDSYFIRYNTNNTEFETNVLNPFWSEFIVMKNIWKKGKKSEYIGFEQFDTHFNYKKEIDNLKDYNVIFYTNMKTSGLKQQYAMMHSDADMNDVIDIIKELYGQNSKYENYLISGKVFFNKSCFIMKWEKYDEMCKFLFSILDKLDEKYNLNFNFSNYENFYKERINNKFYKKGVKTYEYQRRAFGYLAERLLSAWIYCDVNPEELFVEYDKVGTNKKN